MFSFGEIHNSRHNLQEIITEKNVNKIRQQIKTPSLCDKRLQTNKSQLISSQLKFKNWPYWLLWSVKKMTSRQLLLSNTFTEIISVDCSQETISIKSTLVGNVTICMKKNTMAQNMFALYDLCGMAFCKNGLDLHTFQVFLAKGTRNLLQIYFWQWYVTVYCEDR